VVVGKGCNEHNHILFEVVASTEVNSDVVLYYSFFFQFSIVAH